MAWAGVGCVDGVGRFGKFFFVLVQCGWALVTSINPVTGMERTVDRLCALAVIHVRSLLGYSVGSESAHEADEAARIEN